jgi:hypothetical protein
MKFAGQSGADVFQKFYMAEGGIDGQNSFSNLPLRKDHVESFRGMTLQCNPELWQSLPTQMQNELERRPDFVALEEQIEDLTEEMKNINVEEAGPELQKLQDLQARRQKLYKERQRLTLEELNRRRQNQPRNHSFQGTSEFIQGGIPLRSPESRSALQDLIALYKDDCRVAYQPVLRPISGCCPVPGCLQQIQK